MTEASFGSEDEFLPFSDRAIIVGIELPSDHADSEDDLNELSSLLATLGVEERGRVIQKRAKLDPKYLIGKGKVEELRQLATSKDAKMVVFDRPLSGPQVRNLEKALCLSVYDRTGIILEIFHRHASTSQAKTQVEIARLEYLLPRMTGAWTHFQRQAGGGVRSRGMGEKQIEVDRRRARERIVRLQRKLLHIQKEGETRRKARSSQWKVALVGYTNSGKTTLMKGLTKAIDSGEDALFATLDTRVKVIDPKTRPKILVSDTVGFIRNLPHSLVESFRSTLHEVIEADVLVHVVDISHENYRQQIEATTKVLEEIGAGHIPIIYAFNKVDALEDVVLPRIIRGVYDNALVISGHLQKDIEILRDHIFAFFKQNLVEAKMTVPMEDALGQSRIFASCLISDSDYAVPGRVTFQVQATRAVLNKLRCYIDSEIDGAFSHRMGS